MSKTRFPEILTALRTAAGFTNIDLAGKAGVPHSLIPGGQLGKRIIGEKQATKIGQALGLSAEPLNQFLFSAMDSGRVKLFKRYRQYPSELINSCPGLLEKAGITGTSIDTHESRSSENLHELTINLNDGRIVTLTTTLVFN